MQYQVSVCKGRMALNIGPIWSFVRAYAPSPSGFARNAPHADSAGPKSPEKRHSVLWVTPTASSLAYPLPIDEPTISSVTPTKLKGRPKRRPSFFIQPILGWRLFDDLCDDARTGRAGGLPPPRHS